MWLALLLLACTGDEGDTEPTPTADTGTVTDSTVEDVFVQSIITPIDILWVLDTSWSEGLVSLDDALDQGFDVLLLADPNWRMGVMKADTSNPQNRGIVKTTFETWPPPSDAFDFPSGTAPSNVREAIYLAFGERQEFNEDFLRTEADLFILVFTDKEDETPDSVINELDFVSWLEELPYSQSKRIGAITTSEAGPAWAQLANTTGGDVYEVGGFKKAVEAMMLEAIGQKKEFFLTEIPAEPPAEVVVVHRDRPTTYEIEEDYTYFPDRNSIEFNKFIPPPDSQIRVTYERYVEGATTEDTDTPPTTPE